MDNAQYQMDFDSPAPATIEPVEDMLTEHGMLTTMNVLSKLMRGFDNKTYISVKETKSFIIIKYSNGNEEDDINVTWKKNNPNVKYHAYRTFLLSFLRKVILKEI